ncbi:MAG: hypothetical protein QM673_17235 [Gordonia sp. (in: high G+C Gram-positive bacteria)]
MTRIDQYYSPVRRAPWLIARTLPLAALVITVATAALCFPSVALATTGPFHPTAGDRITITITSDRRVDNSVTWRDALNQVRYQGNVPLTTHDPRTHRWRGSLVFTSAVPDQRIDVLAQSPGGFIQCAVTVNGTMISSHTQRADRYASAYCR